MQPKHQPQESQDDGQKHLSIDDKQPHGGEEKIDQTDPSATLHPDPSDKHDSVLASEHTTIAASLDTHQPDLLSSSDQLQLPAKQAGLDEAKDQRQESSSSPLSTDIPVEQPSVIHASDVVVSEAAKEQGLEEKQPAPIEASKRDEHIPTKQAATAIAHQETQTAELGPSKVETQLQEESRKLKAQIAQLNTDMGQVTGQFVALKTDSAVLRDENSQIKANLSQTSKKLKELEKEHAQVTTKDKEKIADLEKKLAESQKKTSMINDELVSSKKSIAELTKKSEKFEKEVQLQKDEANIYIERLKMLQHRIESLEKELETAQSKSRKREKEFEELEKELKANIAKAKNENKFEEENNKKSLIEFQGRLEQKEKEVYSLNESIQDLQQVLSSHQIMENNEDEKHKIQSELNKQKKLAEEFTRERERSKQQAALLSTQLEAAQQEILSLSLSSQQRERQLAQALQEQQSIREEAHHIIEGLKKEQSEVKKSDENLVADA